MNSLLPEERKERMASYLAHQRTGVISTIAKNSIWAIPVWYQPEPEQARKRGLVVECLIPRWADISYHMTDGSKVLFIVQASSANGLRWLQIQGTASLVEAPDWKRILPRWVPTAQPHVFYSVVRVTPRRIDLIDEELGWGVQETLEW